MTKKRSWPKQKHRKTCAKPTPPDNRGEHKIVSTQTTEAHEATSPSRKKNNRNRVKPAQESFAELVYELIWDQTAESISLNRELREIKENDNRALTLMQKTHHTATDCPPNTLTSMEKRIRNYGARKRRLTSSSRRNSLATMLGTTAKLHVATNLNKLYQVDHNTSLYLNLGASKQALTNQSLSEIMGHEQFLLVIQASLFITKIWDDIQRIKQYKKMMANISEHASRQSKRPGQRNPLWAGYETTAKKIHDQQAYFLASRELCLAAYEAFGSHPKLATNNWPHDKLLKILSTHCDSMEKYLTPGKTEISLQVGLTKIKQTLENAIDTQQQHAVLAAEESAARAEAAIISREEFKKLVAPKLLELIQKRQESQFAGRTNRELHHDITTSTTASSANTAAAPSSAAEADINKLKLAERESGNLFAELLTLSSLTIWGSEPSGQMRPNPLELGTDVVAHGDTHEDIHDAADDDKICQSASMSEPPPLIDLPNGATTPTHTWERLTLFNKFNSKVGGTQLEDPQLNSSKYREQKRAQKPLPTSSSHHP